MDVRDGWGHWVPFLAGPLDGSSRGAVSICLLGQHPRLRLIPGLRGYVARVCELVGALGSYLSARALDALVKLGASLAGRELVTI